MMMTEHPLLLNDEMVRAVLDGRKTQTRRPMQTGILAHSELTVEGSHGKWAHVGNNSGDRYPVKCPFGAPGGTLWVRETHYRWTGCGEPPEHFQRDRCYADDPELSAMQRGASLVTVPSIHMPRWASRITLVVRSVRVERVQDITPMDCKAEGTTGREAFGALWDSIYAKRGLGWDVDPWVWVVEWEPSKSHASSFVPNATTRQLGENHADC